MFLELFVFSEVFFSSEVYQNISRIDLDYVAKTNTSGRFWAHLQPVIWFLFLRIERSGREFRRPPPHSAENVARGPEFLLSTRLRVSHRDPSLLPGLHMLSSYEPPSSLQFRFL